MPRRARLRLAGVPLHIIQRGHNRAACFHADVDRLLYLDLLRLHAREHRVAVHSYVLMTNHVHLLVTPEDADAIGALMKSFGQQYAQYFNRARGRTGSLWEGRFRSCLVDREGYLLTCHRYIEMNPVRACMVERPDDYRWSSYRGNALGAPDRLLTPHPVVTGLGRTLEEGQAAYRELFREELQPKVLDEIRGAARGGHALGSALFLSFAEQALGRRVTPDRRGPKKKAG